MNYYQEILQSQIRQREMTEAHQQRLLVAEALKQKRAARRRYFDFTFLRSLLPHRQERSHCSTHHELA